MFASQKLHSRFSIMCSCMRRASNACIWSEKWPKTGKLIQLKNIRNFDCYDRHSTALFMPPLQSWQFRYLSTGVLKQEQLHSGMTCSIFPGSWLHRKKYSNGGLSELKFEKIAEETLEHLCDFFEELGDSHNCSEDYDVTYGDGVLTVKFGAEHGTYVINKQTPNKQIWLSSPVSGPKRYDYTDNRWIYKHDSNALHDLLTEEISQILKTNVDVTQAELTER